jgi:hypothetical protein
MLILAALARSYFIAVIIGEASPTRGKIHD